MIQPLINPKIPFDRSVIHPIFPSIDQSHPAYLLPFPPLLCSGSAAPLPMLRRTHHRYQIYCTNKGMDSLPDAVVQYILSTISDAKDVASCNCLSKKWKDSMPYVKSLYFPRSVFDNLKNGQTSDSVVMQIISSIFRLEDLVVYCTFTSAGLASWLSVVGSSLKNLELRMDNLVDQNTTNESLSKLECIQYAETWSR